MQRLEVRWAVRLTYTSLGAKGLNQIKFYASMLFLSLFIIKMDTTD